jgi:hypothetical protein
MVFVVDEHHAHATLGGVANRAGNHVADPARQADVVESDLEPRACGVDELDDPPRDRLGGLAAVRQLVELESD